MAGYLKIDEKMTSQERRQQAYREKYKKLHPAWDDSTMLLAKMFRDNITSGATVLDAGCGRSNYVLEVNRDKVKKMIGVDVAREATAGNTLIEEIVIANLEKLPFPDNSFDAVISLWVLEHVHNPENIFSEIRRVLKPGGKFFFVTPYSFSYVLIAKRIVGANLTRIILDKLYGRTEDDTFHTDYVANTPKDLRKLFTNVGMKEILLIENPDPSYLAFNDFFFYIALLIQRIGNFFKWRIAIMHLIGVFEKR